MRVFHSRIIFVQAQMEAKEQQREYDETKKQIEEDGDREILDIKNKYEKRLRDEQEKNLKLKNDSGIMRKKVNYQFQLSDLKLFSGLIPIKIWVIFVRDV